MSLSLTELPLVLPTSGAWPPAESEPTAGYWLLLDSVFNTSYILLSLNYHILSLTYNYKGTPTVQLELLDSLEAQQFVAAS